MTSDEMLKAIKSGDLSVSFKPALFNRAPSADPPTYFRDGYEESVTGYLRADNPRANLLTVTLHVTEPTPEPSVGPEVSAEGYA